MYIDINIFIPQVVVMLFGVILFVVSTTVHDKKVSDKITAIGAVLVLIAVLWFFIEINHIANGVRDSIKLLQY